MSTRGCIARLKSKPGKKIRFAGVYAHWDNYPSGTGSTLFQLRNGHFKGDTDAMLKVLIDEHPAGWSTINGADFDIPVGFVNLNELFFKANITKEDKEKYQIYKKTPQCYCHGDKSEEPIKVTQKNASSMGCEYVYAFTPDGKTMVVLSSYAEDGQKMIGMFGCGDPKANWIVIGEINLDGIEPTEEQWEKRPIEQSTKTHKESQNKIKKAIKKEVVPEPHQPPQPPKIHVSDLPEDEKKYVELLG